MIFHFCHSTFRVVIQISKSRFTKMGWDFQSTLKKKSLQGFTLNFTPTFLGHDLKGIKAMTFLVAISFKFPFPKPFTLHHLDLPIWFLLEPTQSEERLFVKRNTFHKFINKIVPTDPVQ